MHSVLFQFGPFTVHTYGVMMALGFLLGLLNWRRVGRREGLDFTFCSDLLFWIMLAGVAGGRLVFVAQNWPQFAAQPWDIVRIDKGGLVYYGGLLGAGLALVVFTRRRQMALPALLDFVVTSVPLGHALGRVGCFLHGCCHGMPTGGAWGVRYPIGSLAWEAQVKGGLIPEQGGDPLPVHPVQLYEAAFNLLLFALLARHYPRRRAAGTTTALYLVGYGTGRFFLEFLRGHEQVRFGPLSASQVASVGLVALGLLLAAFAARERRSSCAPSPDPKTPVSGPTAG